MADLEDFFSKRDKKKKTKGKKFESVDMDDVAKVLDAKAKERKKLEVYQPPVGAEPANDHGAKEDEDWKEAPDDTPDFTGLKIQEFSLAEEEEAIAKEAEARATNDKEYEGPWKVKKSGKPAAEAQAVQPKEKTPEPAPVAPASVSVPVPEEKLQPESPEPEPQSLSSEKDKDEEGSQKSETPVPPAPVEGEGAGGAAEPEPKKYLTPAQKKRLEMEAAQAAETPKPRPTLATAPPTLAPSATPASGTLGGGGKYIPPSQRAGAISSSASSLKNRPRKAAPNIDSEEYFPTLGGGKS